jgi:phage host-nuclease inhibitor protein Gam
MISVWNLDLDKCANTVFKTGTLVHSQNTVTDINREIQELEQGKTYEHLRIEESKGTQNQQMKEKLKKEYCRRLRKRLTSKLKAKNKITAIGALAVPALRYSFGIINWRLEEIKKIYRKTRMILTMYKMHHPKADKDRLHVKRKDKGSGLLQIAAA